MITGQKYIFSEYHSLIMQAQQNVSISAIKLSNVGCHPATLSPDYGQYQRQ